MNLIEAAKSGATYSHRPTAWETNYSREIDRNAASGKTRLAA